MTIDVSYTRGSGGISLTAEQQDQLQALFDTQLQLAQGDPAGLGLGTPLYQLILSFISDTQDDTLVPKAGVDPTVWRWIEGATKVNSGEGFFADFIRE